MLVGKRLGEYFEFGNFVVRSIEEMFFLAGTFDV